MIFITATDLEPFADIPAAKADAMIEDAEAQAIDAAPCLVDPDDPTAPNGTLSAAKLALVKSILRSALLRWNDAGTGATQQQVAGPFSHTIDTKQPRRSMFWPSELDQLRGVCGAGERGGAFAIDTLPPGSAHLAWCSLKLGATYCSCGVDIAGAPLYEGGN